MARPRLRPRPFALSLIVTMTGASLLGCGGGPPPPSDPANFQQVKKERMEIIRKEYGGESPAAR